MYHININRDLMNFANEKNWIIFWVEIVFILLLYLGCGQIVPVLYVLLFSFAYKLYPLKKDNFLPLTNTENIEHQFLLQILIVFFSAVLLYGYLVIIANINYITLNFDFDNFFNAVILAPIGEEIIFRYYITSRLESFIDSSSKRGLLTIIILSSFLFAIGHTYQGFAGVLTNFFRGILLCAIFYKYNKNLTIPIALHMAINIFASIL